MMTKNVFPNAQRVQILYFFKNVKFVQIILKIIKSLICFFNLIKVSQKCPFLLESGNQALMHFLPSSQHQLIYILGLQLMFLNTRMKNFVIFLRNIYNFKRNSRSFVFAVGLLFWVNSHQIRSNVITLDFTKQG